PTNIIDTASPGSGPAIQYTYDDLADAVGSELTREGLIGYSYDLNGRRTSMTNFAGIGVNYTYYNDDRLQSATSSSPALGATLTYDDDGRRASLAITSGANNVTTGYDNYDAASRLTDVSYKYSSTTLGNLHYTYDNDDRIIGVGGTYARTNLPATATATYTATNQVQTWNSGTGTIDDQSNLTKNPSNNTLYAWDARNMLKTSTPSMSFTYDATGRRETVQSSTATTEFSYDGSAPIRATVNPDTAPVTTDYSRLLGGEVTGFVSSAAPTTIGIPLHDLAGSTIALLNPASGAITNSFTYEPFGTGTVTGPATTFPFRFKGMEFDSTTNLYHSGDGYYSPKLQRSIAYPGASGGGGSADSSQGSSPLGVPALPSGSGAQGFGPYMANSAASLASSAAAGAPAYGAVLGLQAAAQALDIALGIGASSAGPIGWAAAGLTLSMEM